MKTHEWHRTVFLWVGVIVCINYIQLTLWILLSFAIQYIIALSVSVGYHRLFNHRSFDCSDIWKWFFGVVGCIGLNASPVEWSIVHTAHHKFSDKEQDPHESSWKYYFRLRDNDVKLTKHDLILVKDKFHAFLSKHSLSLNMTYGLITFSIFGAFGLLYLYFLPITLNLLFNSLHTVFAHRNKEPINVGWMELLAPQCGEWLHKEHHKSPKSWNIGNSSFDTGALFIKLIKT